MRKPSNKKASIIPQKSPTECYFCRSRVNLVIHHCLHGRGIKPLADADGLTVWLCGNCHNGTNESVHLDPERKKDKVLQKLAQDTLIKEYMRQEYPADVARGMFLKRYGRFYD